MKIHSGFSNFSMWTVRLTDVAKLIGTFLQLIVVNIPKQGKITHHKYQPLKLQHSDVMRRPQHSHSHKLHSQRCT